MEGEGELGEWLKQTGREVARAAGSELKSVAKDKAASYARSMIGEGLKEELGDAAGAVGNVFHGPPGTVDAVVSVVRSVAAVVVTHRCDGFRSRSRSRSRSRGTRGSSPMRSGVVEAAAA